MAIAESTSVQVFPSRQTAASTKEELTELLTVQEAAQFLKVTVSWVYEHVRPEAEDRLPVLKLGQVPAIRPTRSPHLHRRQTRRGATRRAADVDRSALPR